MRIELSGARNTRDLGGIPAADGRPIRKNRLIRSGALCGISPDDVRVLKQHHLVRVIDFRTSSEHIQRPDVEIANVQFLSLPLVLDQTIGITREKNVIELMTSMATDPEFCAERYMQNLYSDFVRNEFSVNQLRRFFELLLDTPSGAVLWHCTAGKDRVGVATALLLTVLGSDIKTVFSDYMLTNEYVSSDVSEAVSALAAHLDGRVSLRDITAMVTTLYTVNQSYLLSVFREMAQLCGSVEEYLRQKLGISKAVRNQFQKLYLEP